jgi:lysophospholipase L1-like esterase
MSRFRDRAEPGPMAHPDPKVAEAVRRMAHPIRRGPLGWLQNAFAARTAGTGPAGADGGAARLLGRFVPRDGRRKELAIVLALLLTATAISASLPGGWTGGAATPSPTTVAAAVTSEPTPTDTPTATPTPDPTATPTPDPTATPSPTPTPTPTKAPVKTPTVYTFVALGDSLTSGYNNPGPAWPPRLDSLDVNLRLVNNAGKPGDTTAGMLSRLSKDVYAYSPNVLFVLGGTNDIGMRVDEATTISNLRAIIVSAKGRGIKVFLLTVPPNSSSSVTARIDSLNAAIQHLANSYQIILIDIHTPLSGSDGLIQSRYVVDGLHFNNLGAQLVANTIYNRIHRLGY